MADQDLMMAQTLPCPLELPIRAKFCDGIRLMAGCKSEVSPLVMGMEHNWRSILVNIN